MFAEVASPSFISVADLHRHVSKIREHKSKMKKRKAKHQTMFGNIFFAKTKVTSKQATSRVMSVAEAKRHYAKFKELRTSYQEKTGVNLFAKRFAIGTGTFKTKHMQSNE